MRKILKWIFTAIASLASLAAAAVVLCGMFFSIGNPLGTAAQSNAVSLGDKFDMYLTNRISSALDGVLSVRKVYWLSDEDLVAPEPDPASFGSTPDPASLQWLLDGAADLLEGQELYFTTETQLMPDTEVLYYWDDTILTITWKEIHHDCVYTFSEVKIAHPSQFRRYFPEGTYNHRSLYSTTSMAALSNAVVASSGDFYKNRPQGIVTYQGEVCRSTSLNLIDTCFVDDKGDLILKPAGSFENEEQVKQFVDENNISFSLCFGPILVEDGVQCEPPYYPLGEVNEHYSRAALCQMDELHYLLITANADWIYVKDPTIHRFAQRVAAFGCEAAYTLDGGQTAVIAMNDRLINHVLFGYQRPISDMIYFGTALPELNPEE